MALPKSRFSGIKFLVDVRLLPVDKVVAIEAIGFSGLLQLAVKEIRYGLC